MILFHGSLGVDDYLLFSSNKLVRGILPDESVLREAILPISPKSARLSGLYFDVACDIQRRWVFYADIMDNVVNKIRPDGTDKQSVLVTNNDGLVSMSYDWVAELIYFVDNIRSSLEVVHADDPSMHRQLRLNLKVHGLRELRRLGLKAHPPEEAR